MFQNLKHSYGRKLAASDGPIGHIKDFYFDEATWTLRYIVVETDSWLSGREVLISARAFDMLLFEWNVDNATPLTVRLTRQQIQDSPPIDEKRPVSRQYEIEYHHYYGWPLYWTGESAAFSPTAADTPVPEMDRKPHRWVEGLSDPATIQYLRSTKKVTGYSIMTRDGAFGKVSSFMLENGSWAIREIVLEIGHWYSGKPILLLPENVIGISHEAPQILVNLSTAELRNTLKFGLAQAERLYAVPA